MTSSIVFENGIKVEAAASKIFENRGEDEYLIITDVAKAVEELAESFKNPKDLPQELIVTEGLDGLGAKIREAFGTICLFAILDGHSPEKHWFSSNLLTAFALEIDDFLKSNDWLRSHYVIKIMCRNFPKRLHLMVRTHLRKNGKDPATGRSPRVGSTLSFVVMTRELAIQGVVGDSPIALFMRDGSTEELTMQSVENMPRDISAGHMAIRERYWVSYEYGSQQLRMYNSLGTFDFDRDVHEAIYYYQHNASEEEKKDIREELDGYAYHIDEAPRIPQTKQFNFIQHENCGVKVTEKGRVGCRCFDRVQVFTRRAEVETREISALKGGVICSDGFTWTPKETFRTLDLGSRIGGVESMEQIVDGLNECRPVHSDDSTILLFRVTLPSVNNLEASPNE